MNFLWGGLQITTDNRSGTFHNAANAGPSLAMLFGASKGRNFTSGATDSLDVGKLFAYADRVPFQCAGSVRRRFLVEDPDMAATLSRLSHKSRFLLASGVGERHCEQCCLLETLYGK